MCVMPASRRSASVAQGEPDGGVLRRGVHRLPGHGDQPGERHDRDDVPAGLAAHDIESGEGAIHRAQTIDLHHQPAGVLVLLPGRPGDQHTRVVDPEA